MPHLAHTATAVMPHSPLNVFTGPISRPRLHVRPRPDIQQSVRDTTLPSVCFCHIWSGTTKSCPPAVQTPSKPSYTGRCPPPAAPKCRLHSPPSATITDTVFTTIATLSPIPGAPAPSSLSTRSLPHGAASSAAVERLVTRKHALPPLTPALLLLLLPSTSLVWRATTALVLLSPYGSTEQTSER